MQRRFSKWLEQLPAGPLQVFLVYLAFILLRLQVEMLFLDPNRSLDFFVFNIWYFFSLLLSLVLLAALFTREHPNHLFRLSIPFSAVILIPLLDRIFYPFSTAEELLPLCRLPLHDHFGGYLSTLFRDVLAQRVFLEPGISAGLRLEVFLVSAGLAAYAWYCSGRRLRAAVRGLAVYALCLAVVYAHGVLVVHPGTRRWVFIFLVMFELLVLLAVWYREVFSAFMRHLGWLEFVLLATVTVLAFRSNPSVSTGSWSRYGALGAALVSLLFLGAFIGFSRHRQFAELLGASTPGCQPGTVRALACIGCLLAAFLASDVFFTTCAVLLALSYVLWLSPLRLARNPALAGVCGALAVWVVAWGGYFCSEPPLTSSPVPPAPAGMFAPDSIPPDGSRPHPSGLSSFPPPPALIPATGSMTSAPQLPGVTGHFAAAPPHFPGLRTSGTAHPDWLFHPFWLALPALLCGVLKLSGSEQPKPGAPNSR